MLKIIALALLLAASPAFADTPAYRAHATATGKNPTVTITPAVGDTFFVFVLSDGHSITDLNDYTITDNNDGDYWNQRGITWEHPNGKWAKAQTHMRDTLLANTNSTQISIDTGGKTAVAIVVAVSGFTAINNHPVVGACGTLNANGGSVRQVKCNSASQAFVANETPVVPKSGQQNAFASTSFTFAVLANEQSSPSVTAPTDWTQRAAIGTTASGKSFGLSIATRDSGFSGQTVTWGSSTPTPGNAMVVEVQPLQ
jgi:hypothetical protein